jgi:alpha-ketoglutarate-dependent taurine dioxygenase
MGTVLRAVELPEYGGDTCWVNMYDVLASMSPAMQEMLEGLTAEHDFMKVTYTTFDDLPDPEAELRNMRQQYPVMQHPVVRTERYPVKPMYVDEAVLQLEMSHRQFLVFRNARDSRVNVLYRRRGGDFGLIEPATS